MKSKLPDLTSLNQIIRDAFQAKLNLRQPYTMETGAAGEVYGVIDLADTLDDDPEYPGLAGSTALRVAMVGEGNIILTTFIEHEHSIDFTREKCGTRFLELSLQLREAVPQISSFHFGQHHIFRKLAIAGRSERSISQPRNGTERSLWTINIFTRVNVHLIVKQNVMARTLEL